MWILYLAIIVFILLLLFAKLILYTVFGKRCQGNSKLKLFTVDDFENLEILKNIEVKSNKGQILKGNIYINKEIKKYKGIIILAHGMGGGHLSYTTEINTLAEAGFMVIGYDNTGTMSSDGKNLKGFFQSVIDLHYVLNYINEDEELKKYSVGLIGHSWGAYTVCQVLQFKHNIKAVVAMSGFNSTSQVIVDSMKDKLKISFNFLKPFFAILNFITFGKKGLRNTLDVIKDVNIPILLLHGNSDSKVDINNSLIANEDILKENKYIKTVIYDKRCHNIYQTKESEDYLNKTLGEISELNKKYKGKIPEEESNLLYNNIDYKKMTEESKEVMDMIIKFFEEQI